MKKFLILPILALVIFAASAQPASAKERRYSAKGEVVTVDPPYGRVTIRHGAIKGFAAAADTDFVASKEQLKPLERRDLVDFEFVEEGGDARIEKISVTGEAAPEDKVRFGQVVQDALVGTGEVAKTITTPIAPVHGAVSSVAGATTDTTGAVLTDADSQVRSEF